MCVSFISAPRLTLASYRARPHFRGPFIRGLFQSPWPPKPQASGSRQDRTESTPQIALCSKNKGNTSSFKIILLLKFLSPKLKPISSPTAIIYDGAWWQQTKVHDGGDSDSDRRGESRIFNEKVISELILLCVTNTSLKSDYKTLFEFFFFNFGDSNSDIENIICIILFCIFSRI